MTYTKDNIVFEPFPSNPRTSWHFINLTDQVFTRLTVLGYAGKRNQKRTMWWCECICGVIRQFDAHKLRSGHTRSCGCLARETIGNRSRTHGLTNTPEYETWLDIRKRCTNPNYKQWMDYGGRGIRVCKRWDDFTLFLADMGKRPKGDYSIDRIDNDGNYEPSNCEWNTREGQNAHTRRSKMITYQERTQSLPVWCRELHIPYDATKRRFLLGWTPDRAFTIPVRKINYPRKQI